jgi:hypothetical protein
VIELTVMGVAALVLIGVVAWHVVDVVWARRLVARRRVLVNLRSGRAMNGVMWSRRGRTLVLQQVELIEPGSAAVVMDGMVVVDRDQVEFVQVAG